MANKKITLKKRLSDGTYDVLYPETSKANLLKSDGSALTTFGQSVLETNLAVTGNGFGVSLVNEDPVIDNKLYAATASEARSYFEVAKRDHEHLVTDIAGMTLALSLKVPLENGKIPEQYFPAINRESMTFVGTSGGSINSSTATNLVTAFGWNLSSQFLLTQINTEDGSVKPNIIGNYIIVSGSTGGYFTNAPTHTQSGLTFNFKFRALDVNNPDFEVVDDYQPDNNDLAVFLEPGDRIVLTDITRPNLNEYLYSFDVINTNYSYGGVDKKGAAALSNATSISAMNSSSNSALVVDEKVMRDSMKDIAFEESYTATTTITASTYIKYGTTNPTTSTVGAVNDKYVNITNGSIFKCTVATTGGQPSYTWVSDGSIINFAKSALDVSTYYVLNNIYWVVASDAGVNKTTEGHLENFEPVANDLVFVA
jgi:hypothetical protein